MNLILNLQLSEIQKMAMQLRHIKEDRKIKHLFRDFNIELNLYIEGKSSLTFVACNYHEINNQGEQGSQLSLFSVGRVILLT